MSKTLEAEIEAELEQLTLRNNELEKQNIELRDELTNLKVTHIQKTYYTQRTQLERSNNQLQEKCESLEEAIKKIHKINRDLETEIDDTTIKVREKDCEIDDLKNYINKTLEDLAITCSELDAFKEFSQESTQRLKDHIGELSQELEVVKRRPTLLSSSVSSEARNGLKLKLNLRGKNAQSNLDSLIQALRSQVLHRKALRLN